MPKQTPGWLTALGGKPLPASIQVDGREYLLARVFKNDFFAVTARYDHADRSVILKVGRQAPILLFPLAWVGRLLAAREEACFRRLEGVEGVPRLMGRWGRTGIVRDFVEGHALRKGEPVPDDFHERLGRLVDAMHERGMAYVDLEKCENVLVGDDGRPHLFDFQISWYLPKRWGGETLPARWVRRRLQQADRYHLVKLQRRTRPDQLSAEALAASYRRPWYIRAHRVIAGPATALRRRVLARIDPKRKDGERGRVDGDGPGGPDSPAPTGWHRRLGGARTAETAVPPDDRRDGGPTVRCMTNT